MTAVTATAVAVVSAIDIVIATATATAAIATFALSASATAGYWLPSISYNLQIIIANVGVATWTVAITIAAAGSAEFSCVVGCAPQNPTPTQHFFAFCVLLIQHVVLASS